MGAGRDAARRRLPAGGYPPGGYPGGYSGGGYAGDNYAGGGYGYGPGGPVVGFDGPEPPATAARPAGRLITGRRSGTAPR